MNTERSSLFLMANLGSEVSRIISSRKTGDHSFEHESLERAEKMIGDIKKLPDMQSRAREIDLLSYAITQPDAPESLQSYFEPFIERLFASRV